MEEDNNPPVQDSAKTRDSLLLSNSLITTFGKLSSSSPNINSENSFLSLFFTGFIITFAKDSFFAF